MGKGWLRNLKQAETGMFLRAICVNLSASVDNSSPLSRIRVICVIHCEPRFGFDLIITV